MSMWDEVAELYNQIGNLFLTDYPQLAEQYWNLSNTFKNLPDPATPVEDPMHVVFGWVNNTVQIWEQKNVSKVERIRVGVYRIYTDFDITSDTNFIKSFITKPFFPSTNETVSLAILNAAPTYIEVAVIKRIQNGNAQDIDPQLAIVIGAKL